jgi:hypothetical protein
VNRLVIVITKTTRFTIRQTIHVIMVAVISTIVTPKIVLIIQGQSNVIRVSLLREVNLSVSPSRSHCVMITVPANNVYNFAQQHSRASAAYFDDQGANLQAGQLQPLADETTISSRQQSQQQPAGQSTRKIWKHDILLVETIRNHRRCTHHYDKDDNHAV